MNNAPSFRALVEQDRPLLGMFMFSGSEMLVEILGSTGFDFVILDLEHGRGGVEGLANLIRAAESFGVCPLVRVPDLRAHEIGRALDARAAGVILCHTQTTQQAEEAAALVRYPTDGRRSMCTAIRSSGYSAGGWDDYITRANRDTVFIPLIEDPIGVDNLEKMVTIPGVDGLFVGPGDLSQALGAGSQGHAHPAAIEATRRSIDLARQHDKFSMGVCYPEVTPEAAADLIKRGINALVYSIDARIFFNATRAAVRDIRDAIGAPA